MKHIYFIVFFVCTQVFSQNSVTKTLGEFSELKVYDLINIELIKSDEVFITSSGSLITPIIQIDKVKINNKKIGTITKFLALSFYKAII